MAKQRGPPFAQAEPDIYQVGVGTYLPCSLLGGDKGGGPLSAHFYMNLKAQGGGIWLELKLSE